MCLILTHFFVLLNDGPDGEFEMQCRISHSTLTIFGSIAPLSPLCKGQIKRF